MDLEFPSDSSFQDFAQNSVEKFLPLNFEKWKNSFRENEFSRKQGEAVLRLLTKRARLELEYGNKLQEMAMDLKTVVVGPFHADKKSSGGSPVEQVVDSFILEFTQQGEQSVVLGNSINQDIIECNLKPTLENHQNVECSIRRDLDTRAQNFAKAATHFIAASKHYQATGRRAEEMSIRLKSRKNSPQQRDILVRENLELFDWLTNAQQEYEFSKERLSLLRDKYSMQVSKCLPCLEDQKKKREACLKDSAKKFFVHSISASRSCQYELDELQKLYESVDNPPVEDFQVQASVQIPMPPIPTYHWTGLASLSIDEEIKPYGRSQCEQGSALSSLTGAALWISEKLNTSINAPKSGTRLPQFAERAISWQRKQEPNEVGSPKVDIDPTDLKLQMEAHVSRLFQSSLESISENLVEESKAIITTLWNYEARYALCDSILSMKLQDKAVVPSKFQFEIFSLLCFALLTTASEKGDMWVGRQVLIMSQYFYFIGGPKEDPALGELRKPLDLSEGNIESLRAEEELRRKEIENPATRQTWSLTRALYNHSLWNSEVVWEQAILISVAEIRQKNVMSQRWQTLEASEALREEAEFRASQFSNPGRLVERISQLMSTFGVEEKEIVSLLRRIVRSNSLGRDIEELIQRQIDCLTRAAPTIEDLQPSTANEEKITTQESKSVCQPIPPPEHKGGEVVGE